MDAVDLALIDALRRHGRATYTELARAVGLSAPTVHERVGKLEASGVITGYHAAVDHDALGYSIGAIISVFLTNTGPGRTGTQSSAAVEDAVADVDAVEDCWFVAGEESLIVKVRVPDMSALEHTIRVFNDIPGVGHTRTTVVLSTRFEGRVRSSAVPAGDASGADVRTGPETEADDATAGPPPSPDVP